MTRDNSISRRTAMKLTGATAATALVAGCSDDGGEENGEENGNESEDGGGDAIEIEPGTRIVLEANTGGWVGQEPEDIADEDNPTLSLTEGEEYEIGWEEGDGQGHNIEVLDDSDEVVEADGEELSTEVSEEGGDDQFLTFDASSEMAAYQCQPHSNSMYGEIQVEGGNGEEEENGEENETEENGAENGEENATAENGAENGEENETEA